MTWVSPLAKCVKKIFDDDEAVENWIIQRGGAVEMAHEP
jgi:hypothetical protein